MQTTPNIWEEEYGSFETVSRLFRKSTADDRRFLANCKAKFKTFTAGEMKLPSSGQGSATATQEHRGPGSPSPARLIRLTLRFIAARSSDPPPSAPKATSLHGQI
ncbi:hypothetical protein NHX12_018772 [Muraenolepis orangiensis]|uniref:Uncharacterized protein n=1 Tax=Muraenolepis orangiensis TaxID=630683 RepID=A0A9Q0IXV4_9TELE|nr:hypothetical protein NHX12_018772 [Muraenolepis orangiensis]